MSDEVTGLPVAGYKPTQSAAAIALVNEIKGVEEQVLRLLDKIKEHPIEADGRWLATGRTDIEKGFSCVCRAVFKPGRVSDAAAPHPGVPVPQAEIDRVSQPT